MRRTCLQGKETSAVRVLSRENVWAYVRCAPKAAVSLWIRLARTYRYAVHFFLALCSTIACVYVCILMYVCTNACKNVWMGGQIDK